jgi:hypothetical protein
VTQAQTDAARSFVLQAPANVGDSATLQMMLSSTFNDHGSGVLNREYVEITDENGQKDTHKGVGGRSPESCLVRAEGVPFLLLPVFP